MELIRRRPRPARAAALGLVALTAVSGVSAALVLAATKPKAWIDQPLPGAMLPFGPTPVTLHAASPVGLAKVRVLVDGSPTAELATPIGDLVTLEWTWTPPSPGLHLLTIVAHGTDGLVSDPASVAVTFVARDDLPPTPAPAESPGTSPVPPPSAAPSGAPGTPGPGPTKTPAPPLPTPTPPPPTRPPTATPPPCEPQGPTLLYPDYDAAIDTLTPLLEWSDSNPPSCLPVEFRIDISESSQFDRFVVWGEVPGDQYTWQVPPDTLVACVNYWWRVRPIGPDGPGEFSATYLFHVIGRSCPG